MTARTVDVDERPRCSRCGGPMNAGRAIVTLPRGCQSLDLPATCSDPECRRRGQKERDEAAIARAIADGVIDP